MNLAQFNQAHSMFVTTYEAKYGSGSATAIPSGIISILVNALLQMLPSLLSGCLTPTPQSVTPADIKKALTDHPVFVQFKLMRSMTFSQWNQHGRKAAPIAIEAMANAPDEYLVSVIMTETDPNA